MKLVVDEARRAYHRQLLRALLRESTYLPDPTSRVYFRHYFLARGRESLRKDVGTKAVRDGTDAVVEDADRVRGEQRQMNLERDARKTLHKLNRANNGYMEDLRKVLMLAYGRIGRRSHELLAPLLIKPDTEHNPDDPLLLLRNRPNITQEIVDSMPRLSRAFLDLAGSQAKQDIFALIKLRLKHAAPDIPPTNLWQDAMPAVRVVNAVKHWYGEVKRKLLPPVKESEWQYLKAVSTGAQSWAGLIPRRKYCASQEDKLAYHRHLRIQMDEDSEARYLGVERRGTRGKPHTLNRSFMQRMYKDVFRHSCSMEWSETRRRWNVTWGSRFLDKNVPNAVTNANLTSALFDGYKPREAAAARSRRPP